MHRAIEIETTAGRFSAVDHGGSGRDCLLVHGTGQNAAAWRAVAALLAARWRVVAFDMRGHGQTPENSPDAQQYWRDIGPIAAALGMQSPILVGHSSGAYAATAYVAAGGRASAVVCVDGFTLDARENLAGTAAQTTSEATRRMLFDMFRYGWRATEAERDAYIARAVAEAPEDWLNAGVEPALLEAVLKRCFVPEGDHWLRRPTLEEIAAVGAPSAEAPIAPCRDVYDRVEGPLLLVWARQGLSAHRYDDLLALASAGEQRRLVPIDASHNVPMQRPDALAQLILAHLPE